ncbi:MAG: dihydropteroate synthase, partial [Nitriliruptoraceae bacterium]
MAGAGDPGTVLLPAGRHAMSLVPGRPAIMGIVNTNPGSFSDTEHLADLDAQLARAVALVEAGADIIDVGTDSGVTYGASVPLEQQVRVAVPLVEALVARGIPVSIDTPFAVVAEATLRAGACMINDVSGLADVRIAALCAEHDAALVILHTRVAHKQEAFLDFEDVVADIEDLFEERTALAVAHGVARERVVLDEGAAVLSRLTSATAWWVQTDAPEGMKLMMRRRLEKTMEGDFETDSMRYKATERYDV